MKHVPVQGDENIGTYLHVCKFLSKSLLYLKNPQLGLFDLILVARNKTSKLGLCCLSQREGL